MVVIRRFGIRSAAKLAGALYALLGLVYGVLFALFFGFTSLIGLATGSLAGLLGLGLALFMLIGMPIAFGIIGLILGALFAFLYNLVAGRIGGLEVEVGEAPRPSRGRR